METGPKYLSFMLRIWKESGFLDPSAAAGPLPADLYSWRASLENPSTGETIFFPSLDRMFVFLLRQAGLVLPREQEET
jgi:hypothetical protein